MSIQSRIKKLETKESGDAEILVAYGKGGALYTSSEFIELIPSERIKALEGSPNSALVVIRYDSESYYKRGKQKEL